MGSARGVDRTYRAGGLVVIAGDWVGVATRDARSVRDWIWRGVIGVHAISRVDRSTITDSHIAQQAREVAGAIARVGNKAQTARQWVSHHDIAGLGRSFVFHNYRKGRAFTWHKLERRSFGDFKIGARDNGCRVAGGVVGGQRFAAAVDAGGVGQVGGSRLLNIDRDCNGWGARACGDDIVDAALHGLT